MGSLNIAENIQKTSRLWHLRYGHLNYGGLRQLKQNEMVTGLPSIIEGDQCEDCLLGKQSKNPFPVGKALIATKNLELVHMDICGPMPTESMGGNRFFLMFVDDLEGCAGFIASSTNQRLWRSSRSLELWWRSSLAFLSRFYTRTKDESS